MSLNLTIKPTNNYGLLKYIINVDKITFLTNNTQGPTPFHLNLLTVFGLKFTIASERLNDRDYIIYGATGNHTTLVVSTNGI